MHSYNDIFTLKISDDSVVLTVQCLEVFWLFLFWGCCCFVEVFVCLWWVWLFVFVVCVCFAFFFFNHLATWSQKKPLLWTRYLCNTSTYWEWEKCGNKWRGSACWAIRWMVGACIVYWSCLLCFKICLWQRGIKVKLLSCLTVYCCFISCEKEDSVINNLHKWHISY